MSVGRLRWTWRSTCSTACWSWDARPTSASPEPRQGWGNCARIPDPCTTAAGVLAGAVVLLIARGLSHIPDCPRKGRGENGTVGPAPERAEACSCDLSWSGDERARGVGDE